MGTLSKLTPETSFQEKGFGKGRAQGVMLPVPMYEGTRQCAGSKDTNTLLCSQMSFTPTQLLPRKRHFLSPVPTLEAQSVAFPFKASLRMQLPISRTYQMGYPPLPSPGPLQGLSQLNPSHPLGCCNSETPGLEWQGCGKARLSSSGHWEQTILSRLGLTHLQVLSSLQMLSPLSILHGHLGFRILSTALWTSTLSAPEYHDIIGLEDLFLATRETRVQDGKGEG